MTGAALGASIDVDVHAEAPGDFVRFASELRFGTGAARYRRANLAEQLTRFADPRYVVARAAGGREAGPVVGGYAIDFRDASRAGARVPGAYRALLGVAPERRGEGVGRALAARARELIDERAATLGEPVLAWGCIDASNAASLGLVGGAGGASDVGGLASWLLYRQAPRETLDVRTLDDASGAGVRLGYLRALRASLADCALADATGVHGALAPGAAGGAVHAVLEGERLVLAARARPTVLAFDTLGPATDALVRHLVMPFGVARRRFDPRAFRYLSLTDVVVVPDAERLWPRFVSTLLARHGAHHALVVLDPSREAWRRLRKASGRWARVATPDVRVLARWHGGGPPALPAGGAVGLHPVDL